MGKTHYRIIYTTPEDAKKFQPLDQNENWYFCSCCNKKQKYYWLHEYKIGSFEKYYKLCLDCIFSTYEF